MTQAEDEDLEISLLAIKTECVRQRFVEEWTIENDDRHSEGEMAMAAAAYAVSDKMRKDPNNCDLHILLWPWAIKWWKPKDRERDLVRAGALIAQELARLRRKARGA